MLVVLTTEPFEEPEQAKLVLAIAKIVEENT